MIKVENSITDFFLDENIKCIGLQMSGGADSTLVAYLVAKTIVKNNLPITLKRITFGFGDKPDYFQKAEEIQKTITDTLSKDVWSTPYTVFYEKKSQHSTLKQLKYLYKNKFIDHTMNGRTKNPPLAEVEDFDNSRVIERDTPLPIIDSFITEPFWNITKDKIIKEFYLHGQEDLLHQTCSCDVNYSIDMKFPCGVCWWCKERQWAFNKIGDFDDSSSKK